MKRMFILMATGLMALTLTTGCQQEQPQPAQQAAPQAQEQAQAPAAAGISGTVVETMNAAGYTYVQVDTGSEKIWAAAPEFEVAVGDAVVVPEGMAMPNYESKTLQRTFDMIYFVDQVLIGGEMPQTAAAPQGEMPEGHPKVEGDANAAGVELGDIAKAKNTVGEVLAAKDNFSGKEVSIRGKVVKYNAQIMGKNWIHLQDGTGDQGANDLTVTTAGEAKVGDTVLVTGKLILNKDFGFGYKYEAMIEDATVKVE